MQLLPNNTAIGKIDKKEGSPLQWQFYGLYSTLEGIKRDTLNNDFNDCRVCAEQWRCVKFRRIKNKSLNKNPPRMEMEIHVPILQDRKEEREREKERIIANPI